MKSLNKPTLKERFFQLLKLNNSPFEIAFGIAIGVFIATLPVYGLHTILVIIVALFIKRVNKIAILLGTNISTVLTFPFITWGGYNLGRLILGSHYPPLQWQTFKYFSYKTILHFFYPLFIGSLIMGLVLAIICYLITFWLITWRKKKLKRVVIILLLILASWLQVVSAADYTGEKITYEASFFGTGEYNDMGVVDLDGKAVKLVTFLTDIIGFKDLEKIYYDPKILFPLRVERDIAYPFSKEYLVEEYNPKTFSLYTKKYVENKIINEYSFQAEGPINNAILLPFYLRTIDTLELGWSLTVYLPSVYKIFLVSIDEIVVPAGKFKAYHFSSQPPKFEIWISQDIDRVPLKIQDTQGYGYTMVMKNRVFNKK